ncbi:hypothetical protein L609_000200004530 [Bacillus subtilis J22]|nr:hypothetical protein L609_000200004530 [Bacillus subtilis J22]
MDGCAVGSVGNPLTYTKQKETQRPQSFFKNALRSFIFLTLDSFHNGKVFQLSLSINNSPYLNN